MTGGQYTLDTHHLGLVGTRMPFACTGHWSISSHGPTQMLGSCVPAVSEDARWVSLVDHQRPLQQVGTIFTGDGDWGGEELTKVTLPVCGETRFEPGFLDPKLMFSQLCYANFLAMTCSQIEAMVELWALSALEYISLGLGQSGMLALLPSDFSDGPWLLLKALLVFLLLQMRSWHWVKFPSLRTEDKEIGWEFTQLLLEEDSGQFAYITLGIFGYKGVASFSGSVSHRLGSRNLDIGDHFVFEQWNQICQWEQVHQAPVTSSVTNVCNRLFTSEVGGTQVKSCAHIHSAWCRYETNVSSIHKTLNTLSPSYYDCITNYPQT